MEIIVRLIILGIIFAIIPYAINDLIWIIIIMVILVVITLIYIFGFKKQKEWLFRKYRN